MARSLDNSDGSNGTDGTNDSGPEPSPPGLPLTVLLTLVAGRPWGVPRGFTLWAAKVATSLHGWLWIALALLGTAVGVRLRPWFALAN